MLSIPVVAFFVPHADLNEIEADDYLKRCGEPQKLINRKVEVSKKACIPAGLTRIITLDIWQWCPAEVSWEADSGLANVVELDGPRRWGPSSLPASRGTIVILPC